MSSKKDNVVLSYHDSLLTNEDVELLEGPFWLNDTLISFYMEYLEKEKFQDADVCFVSPEVTQCLKLSDIHDFSAFLDPLGFGNKSFAIMPLNDCENPNLPGGSHWSLLVYSKPENCFYHIDSLSGSNHHAASKLAQKLSQFLKTGDFMTLNSLQQSNSYDCGVFVLCNIDNIVPYALRFNNVGTISPIKEYEVLRKRHDLKMLIRTLSST